MKQITFTVKVAGRNPSGGAPIPTPVEWKGYQSETVGLVVHKRVERDRFSDTREPWVITHLDSGYTVPYFTLETRRAALAAARELGKVTDWNLPIDDIMQQCSGSEQKRVLTSQVLEISRRYYGQ